MFSPKFASIINIIVNLVLFISKILIGLAFSNLSLISEAMNSLTDIMAAVGIAFAVKINDKEADSNHPFGHTRAESIASYTVGLLMFILGLNIIYSAFARFFSGEISQFSYFLFLPVFVTLILKTGMYFYVKTVLKTNNSPALKANLQDHRNDILIAITVASGMILLNLGLIWADNVISILLALYIIKAAYQICMESIDQLMGKAGKQEDVDLIKNIILQHPEVKKLKSLRTQTLGSKIQVEATVQLDSKMTIATAHDIYHEIQEKVLLVENVQDCLIHIESDED